MAIRILSPEATCKLLDLTESGYRPKPILDLKAEIDAKSRLAEFRLNQNGVIDYNLLDEIVQMKLHLDSLYGAWAEGTIS